VLLFLFRVFGSLLRFEQELLLPTKLLVSVPRLGFKLHSLPVGFIEVSFPLLCFLLKLSVVYLQRISLLLQFATLRRFLLNSSHQVIFLFLALLDLIFQLVCLLIEIVDG